MPTQHIVRSFDDELQYLEAKIAEMGRHAGEMILRAVDCIVKNNTELADEVIADDIFLDRAERDLDEKAITIIAKRQPMAVDLRAIIGTIKISSDLERIGDMGKNIAKRVAPIAQSPQVEHFYQGLKTFADLVLSQLNEVLDAYATRCLERIDAVRERDYEVDVLYTSLYREILASMIKEPNNITACTHLLFCAKNLERVGDHITNIAETLHYIITGDIMPPERPKDDKTYKLSTDDINACRNEK